MTTPPTHLTNIDYGQKILTVNADGDMEFATRIDFTAPGDNGGTAFNWGGNPWTNLIRGNTQVTGQFDSVGGPIQLRDKVTMSKGAAIRGGEATISDKLTVRDGIVGKDWIWAKKHLHTDGILGIGPNPGTWISEDDLKTIKHKAIDGDGLNGLCCFSNHAPGKQKNHDSRNICLPPGEWNVHKMHVGADVISWGKCGNGVHAVLSEREVDNAWRKNENDKKQTTLNAGEEYDRKRGEHHINYIRVREKPNPLDATPFT